MYWPTNTDPDKGAPLEPTETFLEDDHGYANAMYFEALFKRLCIRIAENYGPSKINKDDRCVHKRQADPSPKLEWKNAEFKIFRNDIKFHICQMTEAWS